MTATRKLVVAGSSTTVLVGSLLLGAPAAVAAPADTLPVEAAPAVAPLVGTVPGEAPQDAVAPAGADLPGAVPPAPVEAPEPAPAPADLSVAEPAAATGQVAPPAPAAQEPAPLEAPAPGPAAAGLPAGPAPLPAAAPVAPAAPAAQEIVPAGGVNAGLNVDTLLTAAPLEQPAGAGVLTALLAAAVALPGALALRARRVGRTRG